MGTDEYMESWYKSLLPLKLPSCSVLSIAEEGVVGGQQTDETANGPVVGVETRTTAWTHGFGD